MNRLDRVATADRSLSEELANRFLALPSEDIPAETLGKTALCVLDTVGVALAATGLGKAQAAVKLAEEAGGRGEATVWGTAVRASASDAALANGTLAHALDYDDTHTAGVVHSSAVIVPAALALGETIGRVSGRELLTAAILGYEVAARLGRAGPGEMQRHGFHQTSVLGVFGATITAARLLGLSPRSTADALGLAGSMAGGLMEFLSDGSDTKQLHAGLAAQGGLRAARLAAAGARGPRTVLEGKNGLFQSFIDRPLDTGIVLADRDRLEVEEMAVKPYPACHCAHAAVDAILEIRRRQNGEDRGIASIVCEVPSWYLGLVFEPLERKKEPGNAYEGRFSMPFCLASAWIDGGLGPDSFTEKIITEPRRRALGRKVSYEVREFQEFPESFPALVRVAFEDGGVDEAFVPHNRGGVRSPMSEDEIRAKFRECASLIAPPAAAQALEDAILELPQAVDLKRVSAALQEASRSRVSSDL